MTAKDRKLAAAAPLISVIVPVHNQPDLGALPCAISGNRSTAASRLSWWTMPRPLPSPRRQPRRRPACCGWPRAAARRRRNHGADAARGQYLVFVDGDVAVHPETLGRIAATFAADATIDAVFGSYDTRPAAPNLFSQYKNLFHHFVHQEGRAEAWTFWTGCGAIRRSVFAAMGGFDPSYDRPCIEDIELGVRLHKAGHRVVLRKDIQVTHLSAGPWEASEDRPLGPGRALDAAAAARTHAAQRLEPSGSRIGSAPCWPEACCCWPRRPGVRRLLVGPALGAVGVWLMDRGSKKGWGKLDAAAAGTMLAMAVAAGSWCLPSALLGLALVGGIILINVRFYRFLARRRSPVFRATGGPAARPLLPLLRCRVPDRPRRLSGEIQAAGMAGATLEPAPGASLSRTGRLGAGRPGVVALRHRLGRRRPAARCRGDRGSPHRPRDPCLSLRLAPVAGKAALLFLPPGNSKAAFPAIGLCAFCLVTTFYPPYHLGGDGVFVHRLAEAGRARPPGRCDPLPRRLPPAASARAGDCLRPSSQRPALAPADASALAVGWLLTSLGRPAHYGRRLRHLLNGGAL